jgi:hypothetical protein
MATKLTRLTHKIAIQLHLVAEICIIFSSGSSRPVRKLLDTHSYFKISAVGQPNTELMLLYLAAFPNNAEYQLTRID